MKKILFILLISISFFGFSQNETLFEKGNKAYNDAAYDEAADAYLKIIANGKASAALYFNLGNVYYKQNKIAPSIYYYEKALLLQPNDQDIKNNLAYAQNMTLDAIAVIPETGLSKIYKNAASYFSFEQWAYASIALMFLFVIGYLLYYFLTYATQKRIAFIISIICFLFAIVTMSIAYAEYSAFHADQPAIVFEPEVIVKSEPNTRSEETFRLHEGAKVKVLEELNDWNKIKIADGQTGWLASKTIKMLKDF